jgi:hypothetical protein
MEQVESNIECSTCGRVGGPDAGCEICHGRGGSQSRAFTRTEENQGKVGGTDRYSRTGNVSLKIVNLPGSFSPADQG